MAVETFATLAETTSTADPGTSGTSFAVTSRTAFPQSGQFRLLVQDSESSKTNREIMLVTAGYGSGAGSFTVTRGLEGTTGVAHASGSYVAQVLTAASLSKTLADGFFTSGRYYGSPVATGAAGGALPLNRNELTPLFVWEPITVDRITVEVTAGGTAGAVVRLLIYPDSGGSPAGTAPTLDAGTVDSTTTGVKEITISQALSRGVYWLAAHIEVAGCSVKRASAVDFGAYGYLAAADATGMVAGGGKFYYVDSATLNPLPALSQSGTLTRVVVRVA